MQQNKTTTITEQGGRNCSSTLIRPKPKKKPTQIYIAVKKKKHACEAERYMNTNS